MVDIVIRIRFRKVRRGIIFLEGWLEEFGWIYRSKWRRRLSRGVNRLEPKILVSQPIKLL